ncbi:MAG: thioredoxin domain-containing protein, partial [Candidatus Woesearchaeota archaeon]|nr:thioredoxin domain-containing protein [Candidatus Woesearchaeota archaeon]
KLNLNLSQFNECRLIQKYKSEIENATLMGKEAGVLGTPTFFINGHVIAGPKPFKTFKTVINEALKNVQT